MPVKTYISALLLSATAMLCGQEIAPLSVDTTADIETIKQQIITDELVVKEELRFYKSELKYIKTTNKTLKKTLKKTDPKAYHLEQEKLKDRLIQLGFYRSKLTRKQDKLKQLKKKYK